MRIEELLRRYKDSEYTITDTVLAALQLVTQNNVHFIIAALPSEVRKMLTGFVERYPRIRVINGPIPSNDAIDLVKKALANSNLPNKTD